MVRARQSHIFEKASDGWYQEPAWTSARLFAVEKFGPGLLVDPACGVGTILKSARKAGYRRLLGSDIVDRMTGEDRVKIAFHQHDFLNGGPPTKGRIDSIICNPPFDSVQEFVERAIEFAQNKVAMISLLRRLPAASWLQRLPLETVYLLTPRPSMPPGQWIADGNKPGGGTQDFCWLVLNKQVWPREPSIKWLHRDGASKKRGEWNGEN